MGSGNAKSPWIASIDVARAAAQLLIKKENFSEALFLTEPQVFTFKKVAYLRFIILNKTLTYEEKSHQYFPMH